MKRWSWCIIGLAAVAAMIAAAFPGAETGDAAPRPLRGLRVTAIYNIRWNGLSIGNFNFNSHVTSRDYTLTAHATIGDLDIGLVSLPVYQWKAETKSEGAMTDNGPKPSSYNFHSRDESREKTEKIGLRFTDNTVTQISLSQPIKSAGKRVPITDEHLRNVVDPLSAVVLLSYRKDEGKSEACEKRLPIFDGKMRYDLTLSSKGVKDVEENGYKGKVYVCGVRYTPIAGHKQDKKDDDLQKASRGIEVWMIPFSEANLMVPYKIVVPVANASMTLTKFDVQLPSQARRSLLN